MSPPGYPSTDEPALVALISQALELVRDLRGPFANDANHAVRDQLSCLLLEKLPADSVAIWFCRDNKLVCESPDRDAFLGNESGIERSLLGNGPQPSALQAVASHGQFLVTAAVAVHTQRPKAILQLLAKPGLNSASALNMARTLQLVGQAVISAASDNTVATNAQFHTALSTKQTCFAIANETKRVLEVDRVSVLNCSANRFRLMATSGLSNLSHKSNLVRAMCQLAKATVTYDHTFHYPNDGSMPPQLEQAVDQYVELSDTKALIIVALQEHSRNHLAHGDDAPQPTAGSAGPVIGALLIEQFHDTGQLEDLPTIVALAADAQIALSNARKHERIFLLPLWSGLGAVLSPRHFTKTLLGLMAMAVAVSLLMFWQVEYYIPAEGTLQPEEKRHVFAKVEGVVTGVHVQHGQQVDAGTALLTLESADLQRRLSELHGQIQIAQQQLRRARAVALSRDTNADESATRERLPAEMQLLKLKIDHLHQQQAILQGKIDGLLVTSPISGEVLSFDLQRQLGSRPVNRGQQLLTVADTQGPWILEIHIRDRHVGEIASAIEASDALLAKFALATDPEVTYTARIRDFAQAMQDHQQLGRSLRIVADVQEEELTRKLAATQTHVKVLCGRRPLGYVWFRDVVTFLYSQLLFRFS